MTTAAIIDIDDVDLPPQHLLRQIYDALAIHPEVKEPLLRVLLTERFMELPAKVDRLQETQDEFREETREQFRAVNERVDRLQESHDAFREETQEQFRVVNERVDRLQESQDEFREETQEQFRIMNERLNENIRVTRSLQGHSGRLRGNSYEDLCRLVIGVILDGWLDGPILADRGHINALLLQARRRDDISRDEYNHGLLPDIIARGFDDIDHAGPLAVVEASITFNRGDLETAARRAEIISRVLGVTVWAFVATQNAWPPAMDEAARQLGVTIVRYESPEYAEYLDD